MGRIKSNKKLQILIILLPVSFFVVSLSYALYTSELNSSDQIRVAKSGKLTLIEKLNGEIQTNNSSEINNISHQISSGDVINKEVYVEFTDAEVSSYLFLVIEGVNWSYDDILKKLIIVNNKSNLLSFNIDSIWEFCEEASSDNKFVFYHLVDVNGNIDDDKYNVMNQIDIGVVTVTDEETINNSSLRFSVYSAQKNKDASAIDAWNYLNL